MKNCVSKRHTGDLVNLHSNNYKELKIRPYDPSTYWTTRVDHKITDKDLVFGRHTWSRLYNRPWEGNLPTIGHRWQQRDDRAATIAYTHTFRPNLLNELRWGFGLNNNPINFDLSLGSTQHGLDIVNQLGLVGLAPSLPDVQLLQSSQLVQPGYGYHRRFQLGCHPEREWRNERFHGRPGRGPAVPYGPSPPVLTFKLFLEGSRIPRASLSRVNADLAARIPFIICSSTATNDSSMPFQFQRRREPLLTAQRERPGLVAAMARSSAGKRRQVAALHIGLVFCPSSARIQ